MYTTRKITKAEAIQLGKWHDGDADGGWAVVLLDGDRETVVDWFADRYAAEKDAQERESE